MSWQNRYPLPWDALDHDRIAAAAEHVLRSGAKLDLLRYTIEARKPNAVTVLFYFAAGLERQWDLLSKVEETFQLYDIADTDEAFVQIDFGHTPFDAEYDLPAETHFEFYSNVSGNSVFGGVGIEIAERLGRHFGVKCEPL